MMNQTSWLCETGASEWACHNRWVSSAKSYLEYADELAREMEEELSPMTVALIALGSVGGALCILVIFVALCTHHRRVQSRLIQAELELDALRKFAPKDEIHLGDARELRTVSIDRDAVTDEVLE